MHELPFAFLHVRLACLLLLVLNLLQTRAASYECSIPRYGQPRRSDCGGALSKIPESRTINFFVEQQLRTAPPRADWARFEDPRAPRHRYPVKQLPILWSQGRAFRFPPWSRRRL